MMRVLALVATALALLVTLSTVSAQSRVGYSSAPLYALTFDVAPSAQQLANTSANNGGFEWVPESMGRQGLAFLNRQGRNYIDVANFTDNYGRTMSQFSGEVSFECWIMQRDVAWWQRAFTFAIGSQTASPVSDNLEFITAVNGGSQFRWAIQSNTAGSNTETPVGTGRYGEWVHIVATTAPRNGTDPASSTAALSVIYANAVNISQANTYLPRAVTRNVNWLGRSGFPSDQRQHAFIDSFYYYNYALPAEAVYAHLQVSRVPVFELTFSVNPTTLTGAAAPTYSWLESDGPLNKGLVRFSGSSQSINLATATGPSSASTALPPVIGGPSAGSPPNAGWSFETIVKFFALTANAAVYDMKDAGTNRIRLYLNSNNNLVFSANSVTVTSSTTVTANTIYHVAAAVRPTTGGQASYTLYINGNVVGTTAGAALATAVSYITAFLGQSTDSTPVYANAAVDAFRVYDIALSQAETSGLASTINQAPSGYNPAEPPLYDNTSPSGPMVSYTFSQPPPAFGVAGLSSWSYLPQDDTHSGVAVFDGQLNAIDLSNYPDDYGNLLPTFFGGSMSFECWAQFLNSANQAMVYSFSGIAGLIDNNMHLMNTYWQDGSDINSLKFEMYGEAGYGKTTALFCHGCTNGNWKHVIVSIIQTNSSDWTSSTSARADFYVDGTLVASGSAYLPQVMFRPNLWLGKSPWPNDAGFFGNMDSFQYYDYGLSAEAVSAHYALTIPPQYELTFSRDPRTVIGAGPSPTFGWMANDTTSVHEGLLVLSGNNYVDLSAVNGNSWIAFQPMGAFGTGRNTPGVATSLANGLAFDVVFMATSTIAGATIFDLAAIGNTNAVTLAFAAAGLTFSTGGQSINCGTVAANTWTHVLVSITPDTVGYAAQCYLNGARSALIENFPTIAFVNRSLTLLGKANSGGSTNFQGQIDAFRIHSTAITSEIAASLAAAYRSRNQVAGAAPYQSGPMISYTFDKPPQNFTDPTNADTYNYYTWLLNPTGVAASPVHTGVAVFDGVGQSNALRQYVDVNFDQDAYGRTMPQFYGGAMSFEVWINIHRLSAWERIFDFADNSNTGWNNGNGAGQFNLILSCNGDNPPKMHFETYYAVFASNSVDIAEGWVPGTWQHVVGTVEVINATSANMSIYSNGVLLGSQLTIPPPVEMRRLAWLGRSNWNDNALNATIDSFYFYNYALNVNQVRLHYAIPNPPMFDGSFDTTPAALTGATPNYGYSAVDSADATHTGVLTFNGVSQFVDLMAGRGANSIGQTMLMIGGTSVGINQDGWSFELSVKFTALTGVRKVIDIGNGNGVDSIAIGSSDAGVYLYVDNGLTDDTTVVPLFAATANTYYHLVVVATPSTATTATYTVYVSGVRRSQMTSVLVPALNRRSAFIGKSNTPGESMFAGSVDVFRHFTYALNASTVTTLASLAGSSGAYTAAPALVGSSSSSSTGAAPTTASSSSSTAAAASSSARASSSSSSIVPPTTVSSSSTAANSVRSSSSSSAGALSASSSSSPTGTSNSADSSSSSEAVSTGDSSTGNPPPVDVSGAASVVSSAALCFALMAALLILA